MLVNGDEVDGIRGSDSTPSTRRKNAGCSRVNAVLLSAALGGGWAAFKQPTALSFPEV